MLTEKEIEGCIRTAWQNEALGFTPEGSNPYEQAAAAIAERLREGMVWSTVHINLQEEDGQFWLDFGPLGCIGPIRLPDDMQAGDGIVMTITRLRKEEEGSG